MNSWLTRFSLNVWISDKGQQVGLKWNTDAGTSSWAVLKHEHLCTRHQRQEQSDDESYVGTWCSASSWGAWWLSLQQCETESLWLKCKKDRKKRLISLLQMWGISWSSPLIAAYAAPPQGALYICQPKGRVTTIVTVGATFKLQYVVESCQSASAAYQNH